jgi:hypothetical protein
MATTYYNQIQQLYVAYFNRPADPDGLNYWEGVMEASKNTDATLKAITAQFSKEAEYTTAFAGMTNGQIIDKIYTNLFGRAADADGKAYWVGLMDSNKVTVDRAVADIAAAAKNQDLVTIQSKVAASVAFTAALDLPAEKAGYNTASTAPAKAFLAGITDAATLAAATAPVMLNATVAKVVAAGTPFTLSSGLSALTIANKAKIDFLDAADGKVDGKFGASASDADKIAAETKIGTDVGAAMTALDTVITGDYTNATLNGRAALLSAQQTLNAAAVADAQAALNAANAKVTAATGLTAAVATLDAAKTAVTTTTTADKAAQVDLAAKLATYNALNGTSVTVNADGTVAGLIEINATTKALQIVSGVTAEDATHKGLNALLASSAALEAADAAVTAATTAQTNAQKAVDFADLSAAAKTDLADIATAMKLAAGVSPTAAQITAQQTALNATYVSAKAVSDAYPADTAAATATTNAKTALDSFNALVTKLYADDIDNPLLAAQKTASDNLTAANKVVTDLAKAVTDLATANTVKAQLDAVNGQVTAANDAFGTAKLNVPVTLDASHAAEIATMGADVYIAGTVNASVVNFGILGGDALYIGNSYTLNTGDYTKGAGNNSVLEAFIVKSGTDTQIVLEKSAFGSNAASPEIVTITLTGVDATKVHLTNGIITVG